ncbi:MAG: hypothetical protein GF364_00875, partial [Candidatus Lokiarchaeota archaeon]|nr:hypothetical protein [Candidatus Lokiarchaeota archaeon]
MKKFTLLEDILVGYNFYPRHTSAYLVEQPTTAPTKPETEPDTKPETEPDDDPDPFHPPQPIVEPKPKAIKVFKEAYEDEVNPNTANFWKDIRKKEHKHIFSKHPILALHGDDLSKQGYEHHKDIEFDSGKMMHLMMQIQKIEGPHKEELEELAKKIIVEIYGIPKEMLQADLTRNTDIQGEQGDDSSEPDPDEQIPAELLKE